MRILNLISLALAGAERGSRGLQFVLNPHCGRVRATEHTPRDSSRVLKRRHGLAEIVELGVVGFVEYFDSDSPRLMVRYEDLLFRTRETTKQICACVGGTMTEKIDPIDQGAKYGSEHRMSLADAPGRKNSRRKYANETRRYGTLTGADLESIERDIDPRLLDAFRYAFSDARRREVVGDDAACSATSSSRWRGH